MARVNKAIEFIKDAAGKIFIKANSIIDDNGDTLQKTLNKPKVYRINGTIVINLNGGDSYSLHSWNDIRTAFERDWGITPSSINNITAVYINGDNKANPVHFESASFEPYDGIFYVLFDGATYGKVRVNYSYFCVER